MAGIQEKEKILTRKKHYASANKLSQTTGPSRISDDM
jgi:hypothetical protein